MWLTRDDGSRPADVHRHVLKHEGGGHDQKTHGRRTGASIPSTPARTIAERILAKPAKERGISINVEGKEPTSGYMVAIEGEWKKVPADRFAEDGQRIIRDYLRGVRSRITSNNRLYFGVWFNTKTNNYEFDLAENVSTKREAMRLGRERKQEAIWDVKGRDGITVGARGDERG